MNTKTITVISIIALLLVAFITNPSKDKHVDNAVEIMFNKQEGDDLGILGGLVETFYKPTIAPKVKIDNYYIFSISYFNSKKRNKKVSLGLGIFGQVFTLAKPDDIKAQKDDVDLF